MLLRTTVIPCPSGLDSPHALVRSHPGQENGKILQKLLCAAANWIASSEGPRKWLTPPHLSPTAARSWPQASKNSSCQTIKNCVPPLLQLGEHDFIMESQAHMLPTGSLWAASCRDLRLMSLGQWLSVVPTLESLWELKGNEVLVTGLAQ